MRRLFALILVISLWIGFAPPSASADVLVPCSDSPAFAQRAKNSKSATAPQRFEFYAKSGVLCGKNDGLPHLIVDGSLSHAGEFLIPSILFLYIAGWIGWVGRAYLQAVKKKDNPEENEIIIDVPLAVKYALTGFTWPLAAIKELTTGELTAKDDEIPVSVR